MIRWLENVKKIVTGLVLQKEAEWKRVSTYHWHLFFIFLLSYPLFTSNKNQTE